MATETGVVTKVGTGTAYVRTTKTSACKSCAAREGCHTLGGGKEMEVEAINMAGAKMGDQVIIRFETSSLVKASFLIYVFPILGMMAGAVIGQEMRPDSSLSVTLGFTFFFLAFLVARFLGNRLSRKNEYRAKIVRIKRHGPKGRGAGDARDISAGLERQIS